jgi:hypothetical protein
MKALVLSLLVMLVAIASANAQSVQRGLNYLRATRSSHPRPRRSPESKVHLRHAGLHPRA